MIYFSDDSYINHPDLITTLCLHKLKHYTVPHKYEQLVCAN